MASSDWGNLTNLPQNYYDLRADRSVAAFHLNHVYSTNFTWEIPTGGMAGVGKALQGDWAVTSEAAKSRKYDSRRPVMLGSKKEGYMSIVRLIFVTMKQDQGGAAERVWKSECAPLMIQQPGCQSEELLKCVDQPGEYISYAEWDSQESIDRYLASAAHREIVRHTETLRAEKPVVKCYELV